MIARLERRPVWQDSSLVILGLAGAAVYAATLGSRSLAAGILATIVAVRVVGMLWPYPRRGKQPPRTIIHSLPDGLLEQV